MQDRFPQGRQLQIWELGKMGISKSKGFCPLGIEFEKHGFRTAWLITGHKFQGVGLKLKVFILTFGDPYAHLRQTIMRMAVGTVWECEN